VLAPARAPAGVVACLPHGGRDYPADLTADLVVSPDILWSDWQTRELYDFLPELGVTTVTTALSRFVADVNRDPGGEQHGGFWSSVVSAELPDGRPVYRRALTEAEVHHRVALAHVPFHRSLDAVIERLLRSFPRLLLLDLHSFGVDLNADVILGDRGGVAASEAVMRRLEQAFTGQGFRVARNERFSGGWTVRRFAGHDRVDAVQIELNQRCYLDLAEREYPSPPPLRDFAGTRRRLRAALEAVLAQPTPEGG
jgi:N-formylglutamate amidohydrolase